ncbi:MAG: 1-acyl-sn-glycerol-3-phosphate acyltransferase [Frankiaceae bacterium]|nr:1-acyl-sn-glycerol-3-phosphate acyltransferase [Frankiaceae bacterium]MBV9872593.1 1-acyl-sn-glycerol-3-phosphate acyltransferase [Frankiaceae bacterium]
MSLSSEVRQMARAWRWTRRPLPPKSAEPHHTFPEPREFPTEWARSKPARVAREAILRGGLTPLVNRETAIEIDGLDIFDDLDGPVIIVANHTSHLDTALLLTTLPTKWQRRVTVGAAADYFFDAWWRAIGSALVFATFPIERHGQGLSDTPAKLLEDGWSIVMFPEGTRSPDGWTRRFRPGASALAKAHGVPIVPVGISGSYAAMPRGRNWPKPGRPPIQVRYGRPIRPLEDENTLALNGRVADAIGALLDEAKTDWYTAQRRAAAGETPPSSGPAVASWRRVWESSAGPELTADRPKAWR